MTVHSTNYLHYIAQKFNNKAQTERVTPLMRIKKGNLPFLCSVSRWQKEEAESASREGRERKYVAPLQNLSVDAVRVA